MNPPSDRSQIPDWGVDLDPGRRPAVPMERTLPRLEGVHWERPTQQRRTVEILHSVERPGVTPVFGTSVPPSGLSGWIRRRAFRRSESDMRHWMLLLLADRVNVVEGLLDDARRSPRARAAAFGLAGAALAVWVLRRRRA
ncbi:hypothetical protein [Fulvimonas yonginensis]|uniref:Uncharacterized protein n=1 Tax=Fulvimonas yonginensis TaxID=1495200 RepID=A0ABU8JD39_9GAMM